MWYQSHAKKESADESVGLASPQLLVAGLQEWRGAAVGNGTHCMEDYGSASDSQRVKSSFSALQDQDLEEREEQGEAPVFVPPLTLNPPAFNLKVITEDS